MAPRPPKLIWENSNSGPYMIQSEMVRGEPRIYYARSGRWKGPARRTEAAAMIDAEYHAAGRLADRPRCLSLEI